jgi:PAP_fibrillin
MIQKQKLLAAIASTKRGLDLTETQKTEIFSAVVDLEAENPHPLPFAALDLLIGDWKLLFTTSKDLLGLDRFPGIRTGEIYQCIRAGKIYNLAEILGLPFLEGLVSVCASFVVVSDQRVKVNFERSVLGLQKLLAYSSVSEFIKILESGKKLAAIDFPITSANQKGWLETTYLDQDLRVGRGNEGSLFVLSKDYSM